MFVEVLKETDKKLLYSLYNTSKKDDGKVIDRFFKEDFKASEFLIYKESGVILCALRVIEEVFYLEGYYHEAYVIEDYIVSGNCSKEIQKHFEESVFNSFKYLKLFTFVKKDIDIGIEMESVFNKKVYKISRQELFNVDGYTIEEVLMPSQLVDVYDNFTQRFNSFIKKDDEYFERQIKYYKERHYEIFVTRDSDKKVMGYVVYKYINNHMRIKEIVYLDTIALLTLLNQAMGLNDFLLLEVSQSENLSKVFKEAEYSSVENVKMIINDVELFQRLYNVKATSMKKFMKDRKHPYYCGVY